MSPHLSVPFAPCRVLLLTMLLSSAGCADNPLWFLVTYCDTTENCPPAESCIEGQCFVTGTAEDCTDDSDCASGVCNLGYCAVDPGQYCSSHDECEAFCDPYTATCASTDVDWGNIKTPDEDDYSVSITSPESLEELKTYNTVVGDLYIGSTEGDGTISIDADLIDLGSIRTITGGLYIENQNNATAVRGLSLKSVGYNLSINDNNAVTTIELPAFERTGDDYSVYINSNRQLENVSMPRLIYAADFDIGSSGGGDGATFPGPLNVNTAALTTTEYYEIDTETLGTITATNLASVSSGLDIDFTDATADIVFPALTQTGDARLNISGDGMFTGTTISFPVLEQTGADIRIYDVDGMTTFSAPALTQISGELIVGQNSDLSTIEFGALSSVISLSMTSNPMLDACAIQDLVTQLGLPPADVSVSGNMGDPDDC